jgi:hypothetical protein
VEAFTTFRKENICIKSLVREPKGKISLGSHRYTQKDTIKKNPKEVEWGGVDYVNLEKKRNQWQALVNLLFQYNV